MSHRYRLFGLTISSAVPLGELPALDPSDPAAADIDIRLGKLPPGLPTEAGHHFLGEDALIAIPTVGRYLARGGRELLIEPCDGVPERNLRLYLLGSAMGMLLHQRGLLPLHANAVAIDGQAYAFMGPSGAGKSTLAAWFQDHGHQLLCDDVCVIGFGEDGRALAWPGLPRLRLWRDALERSGRDAGDFDRSYEEEAINWEKYDVPTRADGRAGPLPLGGFFLLERGEPARIERLSAGDAVQTLFANIYRGEYLSPGQHERQWRTCLQLASRLPVQRWWRSWDVARIDGEVADLLAAIRARTGR